MRIRALFLAISLAATTFVAGAPAAQADQNPWVQLSTVPSNINPGIMFLLTNGNVLVQDQGQNQSGSSDWWILSPNKQGDYASGSWKQTGSMPAGYKPLYAGSSVLPDGRVIVEGGELNGSSDWVGQNLGAIYDPVSGTWSVVTPPKNGQGEFASIADAPSTLLGDGRFMFGPSGNGDQGATNQKKQAILDPKTLTWTVTGTGMAGANPEAGFTLLNNDKVLLIDTVKEMLHSAELFDPATGKWSPTGSIPNSLLDPATAGGSDIAEIGAAITLPSGLVFAEGSNKNTDIYDPVSNSWTAGPDFPVVNGKQTAAEDAGVAVLNNGNVLLDLSPTLNGELSTPASFYIYDGKSFQNVPAPFDQSNGQSNDGYFLRLPSGQILMCERLGPGSMYLYNDTSAANSSWLPTIDSVPTDLAVGTSYTLSGKQLSGLTQGSEFGDDWNNQTNYPLVQITNKTTGNVSYANAVNVTSTSIAPGTPSSVTFTLPEGIDDGSATLRVVASGFASTPTPVTISGGTPLPIVAAPPVSKASTASTAAKFITCKKGSVVKKFTTAKCPTGYVLKK